MTANHDLLNIHDTDSVVVVHDTRSISGAHASKEDTIACYKEDCAPQPNCEYFVVVGGSLITNHVY
jgi:hypothetical protein